MLSPLIALLSAPLVSSQPASVCAFAARTSLSKVDGRPRRASWPLRLKANFEFESFDVDVDGDGGSSEEDDTAIPPPAHPSDHRRSILRSALAAPLSIASFSTRSASAASEKPPPIIPLITTAKRMRAVPTFTIVDGDGVPFHTYDKDSAGGFGYFFTSYSSAEYVLDDAKKAFAKAKTESASKKEGGGAEGAIGEEGTGDVPDAWGRAQIVTIPLDLVMQLSVKKTKSVAQNGKGKEFSTFYQVIPETSDLNAALRIENGPRYSEKGRVPLFYVDGLVLSSTEEAGGVSNPVYFRIKDLRAEWEKQHPGSDLPTVRVRELNETFRAMIRPGGKDESVRNLAFVPIPESVEKARVSGKSYKLGEMILTK